MPRAEFAFIQARLQARHGDAQRATNWQAIEAGRSVAQVLAAVRAGALAHWVESFDDSFDAHGIENVLRSRWRAYVDRVAHWEPAAWRPLTRWFGVLPDLAQIDGARRSGQFGPGQRAAREELAPFATPHESTGAQSTLAIWGAEWERRVPDAHRSHVVGGPARLLLPALAGERGGRGAGGDAVRAALMRLFRRFAATPTAVFAHLALVALDLERLRGGLLVRTMFAADPHEEPVRGT